MKLEYRIGSRKVSVETAKAIDGIRKLKQTITVRRDRFGRFNKRGKTVETITRIIYRDVSRRMASKSSYDKKSNLTTTLRDDHNRPIGTVKGYHSSIKKVAREFLKPVKVQRKPPTRRKEPPIRMDDEYEDEHEDEAEFDRSLEDEQAYDQDYGNMFPELDRMDDMEELLNDEDEWYEKG